MNHIKTARYLRQNLTPEEVKLWVNLKNLNREGYHFRRQVPLDGYILDFAEFKHKLIIEVDGGQHGEAAHEIKDKIRDAHFTAAGFCVLRFWNNDVNFELNGVVVTIIEALNKGPPPSAPRPPPPRGGRIKK